MTNSRSSRNTNIERHIEVPFVVALHLLIASALGLIAAGAGALTNSKPQPSSQNLVKVGIIILLLSWLIILGTVLVTLLPRKDRYQRDATHIDKPREYTDGTIVSRSMQQHSRKRNPLFETDDGKRRRRNTADKKLALVRRPSFSSPNRNSRPLQSHRLFRGVVNNQSDYRINSRQGGSQCCA